MEPGKLDETRRDFESSKVRVLVNARESTELARSALESAKTEVLMMLNSSRAFVRWFGSMKSPDGTGNRLNSAKVKPRLLVPDDEDTDGITEMLKSDFPWVEYRVMNRSFKSRISVLIVDRTTSTIIETDDGAKDTLGEALGVSTFTENRSLAEAYATMFEGIWKQTELNEQLKVHEKMQRDFVNIAAHELRTPVQAIINYAELAKSYEDNREEYYDKLLNSVFRLHRLTEDILDAARIESNTLRLSKEVFLLNDVLRGAVDEQRRSAFKKGLKLYLEQPEPVYVLGDKTRVGQVIANLLINAVKFTDKGYVRVNAKLDKGSEKVIVRVTDTGIGVDRAILPLLFARFIAKSESGTGLGLFISKSIIEAHGGRIWVERSEPGEGSTFTFELPVSARIPPFRRMVAGRDAGARVGISVAGTNEPVPS